MKDDTAMLLACLISEEKENKPAQLSGYTAEDWDAMMTTTTRHGVAPIVYHLIKSLSDDLNIPDNIMENLRKKYYASAARNLRLYRELVQTLTLFNREGIAVILLKGAYLAETVYGNIALRTMSDVDLLVRREDLGRLHELLIKDDYILSKNQMSNQKHLAPYHKKSGVCCLEIHFQIVDPPYSERIDINKLWDRAQSDVLQGVEILTLSPEDLFLHLCIHTCIQHGLSNGIVSIIDTASMLKHYGGRMDWEQLWNRAQKWGIEKSVYLMLALTERMLALPMPKQIQQKMIVDQQFLDVLGAAEDLIFQRSAGTTRYLARLVGPQSWRVKLQYLKQRSFPPKETLFKGGEELYRRKRIEQYLYYCSRLRTLLKRHGKTLWLVLRKNEKTLMAMEMENKRNDIRDWMTSDGNSLHR